MSLKPFFSSSAKVWDDIAWVYGIENAGYAGWEIVADGNYRLDNPACFKKIEEVIGLFQPLLEAWREIARDPAAAAALAQRSSGAVVSDVAPSAPPASEAGADCAMDVKGTRKTIMTITVIVCCTFILITPIRIGHSFKYTAFVCPVAHLPNPTQFKVSGSARTSLLGPSC